MKIIGRRKDLIVLQCNAGYYHQFAPSYSGIYSCKHENSNQKFDIEIDALKEVYDSEILRKLDEIKVEYLLDLWLDKKKCTMPSNKWCLNDLIDFAEYVSAIKYNEAYNHAIDDCVSNGKAYYIRNERYGPDDYDDDKPEIEAHIDSKSLYKLKKNATKKIK